MADILSKPTWIPYYIQRMKGSKAYKSLEDYRFGWYSKLLVESADSDVPGYLPNAVSELWQLAGAKTERFFRENGGPELLARHFKRTEDGLWIYNERMLEVLHEQGKKLAKRRSKSVSSLLSALQSLPDWIPEEEFRSYIDMREEIKKPLTARALTIAVRKLETLKAQGYDPKLVLEESIFNRWQGLFELKTAAKGVGNGAGTHKTTGQERAARNIQALVLSSMGAGLQRVDVPDGGTVQHRVAHPDRGEQGENPLANGEVLAREPEGSKPK